MTGLADRQFHRYGRELVLTHPPMSLHHQPMSQGDPVPDQLFVRPTFCESDLEFGVQLVIGKLASRMIDLINLENPSFIELIKREESRTGSYMFESIAMDESRDSRSSKAGAHKNGDFNRF
jgi:hypothetical protein